MCVSGSKRYASWHLDSEAEASGNASCRVKISCAPVRPERRFPTMHWRGPSIVFVCIRPFCTEYPARLTSKACRFISGSWDVINAAW